MVTFEIPVREVVGMEYSNVLIEDASRFVFEARTLVKRSFHNVDAFFNFYKLEREPSGDNSFYRPWLDNR